jgi:hypothetical protein
MLPEPDPLARMVEQADAVLDEEARASEHLTDAELWDRDVLSWADFYMTADCWLVDPNDPATRCFLIEGDQMHEDFADAVLAKMRELDAAHDAATA